MSAEAGVDDQLPPVIWLGEFEEEDALERFLERCPLSGVQRGSQGHWTYGGEIIDVGHAEVD